MSVFDDYCVICGAETPRWITRCNECNDNKGANVTKTNTVTEGYKKRLETAKNPKQINDICLEMLKNDIELEEVVEETDPLFEKVANALIVMGFPGNN